MSEDAEDATNGVPAQPPEPVITHVQYSRGGGEAAPTHPMFLCLHGWGSNEEDLADIMRYIAPYNDYASLRAPIVLQERRERGDGLPAIAGAYSWFSVKAPSGDDLDREAYAAARAIDRWVDEHVPLERDVVPIGFSQGGLLATHLLRIHPERYRAAINLSGTLAPGNVPGTAPADDRLADYEIPVFYVYGKNDRIVPKYELFATAAWLEEHTWLTTKSYHGLGHEVSMDEFADLRQWLLLHDISSGVL
ncbi:alpha/beta hydrolase-fold protein [Bifidobacterium amazonense]|uniref:Alpha/beta hydrolase-fold protein n=1 Tax=Bifidobacterium amazonense TaxID=2809027 RepID=A0ABS9VTC5_9BIFI|nr:alpha/beta hydrolase-fold protein [Bifidobacterium amazonense]MCH9275341.1 alpha/beta hydrolase-fold protein [Bifidobacterium amazonense]